MAIMAELLSSGAREIAQARSAVYTLLACGFRYPDQALLASLSDPARWTEWPGWIEKEDAKSGELLRRVRQAIQRERKKLATGQRGAEPVELQERYDGLFGHAVSGPCPAYEIEYGVGEIVQQASELADLAGFYRAFGMEIVDRTDGRPDHVAVECEFMSVLCAKEAHAVALQDEAKMDVCLEAEHTFLQDHLGRWLPAFSWRVQEADPKGLYGVVARLAKAFLEAECRRFEVEVGPATLPLKPHDPVQDRTISCGPVECQTHGTRGEFIQLGIDSPR